MEEAKINGDAKPARKPKAEKQTQRKGKRGALGYELPNPLVYRLSDPGYTIYHRAALGGLAATVRAWQDEDNEHDPPEGMTPKLTRDTVELSWSEDLPAVEIVRRILDASFKLTSDKLIDLPGHNIADDKRGLRLAIHNGLVGTFLQHNKMRPGEKQPRPIRIATADDTDGGDEFTYKAIDVYAHQKAQGTGLLSGDLSKRDDGTLVAKIPQSVVPGATGGMDDLQASPRDALLLMFLMIGCSVFMLRPRTYKEKAQSCLIVPDVFDLVAFARALHNIATTGQGFKRFSNSYLGRVVGGAEEAALRFLIDLQAGDVTLESGVSGCIVVAMGKVSWDKQQTNRSVIAKLKNHYVEMGVFRAADEHLGKSKVMKTNKGESFVIPETHIPELVAANLAAERHWCAHFKELIEKKKDFQNMSYYTHGGLKKMKEAVKDATDQTLIHAFQEAWRLKMRALYERARREGTDGDRLIEVERERTRNAILRAKTADALAGWLMQFCADATREYQSVALAKDLTQLREFIFNPRNFERFQNLCLFALVSYTRDETAKQQTATTGGEG
jgi:CRISPR-associated protein Cas8a1/Csx13